MNRNNRQMIACAQMVADEAIYPRAGVDPWQVGRLAQALRAGADLPEIILEESTLRIVDGWHRRAAAIRINGPTATFPCFLRAYESEAALFSESMLLNSRHGQSLSNFDRTRSILLARKLGIPDAATAASLQITVESAVELVLQRSGLGPDAEIVPLKYAAARLAGSRLSAEQLVANDQSGGRRLRYYIGQVLNVVSGDLIDWSEPGLAEAMESLRMALDGILRARSKAA
jgi:hypothetical protein